MVETARLSRSQRLDQLRAARGTILPSLLLCDWAHLADEVAALEEAGVQMLHLDVMDGHFVPNLTYGLPLVAALRKVTRLPLDVHLMIDNPQLYLEQYIDAGGDVITIHAEATGNPQPLLERIHAAGAAACVAINPPTPVETLQPYLDLCDMVLVMSVMPGFGGQKFDPIALDKLRTLRQQAGDRLLLEIDGGINEQTIAECRQAGAELFVVGSAIFQTPDYRQSVAQLTQLARSV